jgi:hypothetical protein
MRVLEGKELEDYLKQMQEWEAKKAKAIEDAFQREIVTGEDITNLLWTYTDSNLRWELFADLAEKGKLSDEAFNKGLAIAWTEGRGTGDFRAMAYFDRCQKELIMDEEELAYYNNLPDKVTLYRGCSIEEYEGEDSCFGISWTTSRDVAEFFAFRNEQEDTAVYSIEVDKEDIKTVFLSRNEFEAICFGGDEVTLVTDEPTELYTNYMERKKQELDEFMNK